jgi:hypothetical protein
MEVDVDALRQPPSVPLVVAGATELTHPPLDHATELGLDEQFGFGRTH